MSKFKVGDRVGFEDEWSDQPGTRVGTVTIVHPTAPGSKHDVLYEVETPGLDGDTYFLFEEELRTEDEATDPGYDPSPVVGPYEYDPGYDTSEGYDPSDDFIGMF